LSSVLFHIQELIILYRDFLCGKKYYSSCLCMQDGEFFGVMRFYYQDDEKKVSTKCIRVSNTAKTVDVLGILIEKFRPDLRMLSPSQYALYEVHATGGKMVSAAVRSAIITNFFIYCYWVSRIATRVGSAGNVTGNLWLFSVR